MAQYVLLDTNILFRYVTQGEPGCEAEHFDALVEFVKRGVVKLFDSEVVELEFKALCKSLEDGLKSEIKRIEEHVVSGLKSSISEFFVSGKKKAWNEIKDLHPWLENEAKSFSDRIKAWSEEKLAKAKTRMESVRHLMLLESTERLSFDENLVFRTKRRFLEKRYKQVDGSPKPESDYNIVDSVVRFFESNPPQPVLFCSENVNDLAIEIDKKQFLHPFVKDDFPDGAGLFVTLDELVKFISEQKPVEQPTPEKVEEALEREVRLTEFNADGFFKAVSELSDALQLLKILNSQMPVSISSVDKKFMYLIEIGCEALNETRRGHIRLWILREHLESMIERAIRLRKRHEINEEGVSPHLSSLITICSRILEMINSQAQITVINGL